MLLHEYLFKQGKIELGEDGKPSFATMTEEFANALANDPEKFDLFETAFNAWLKKQDESQQ